MYDAAAQTVVSPVEMCLTVAEKGRAALSRIRMPVVSTCVGARTGAEDVKMRTREAGGNLGLSRA